MYTYTSVTLSRLQLVPDVTARKTDDGITDCAFLNGHLRTLQSSFHSEMFGSFNTQFSGYPAHTHTHTHNQLFIFTCQSYSLDLAVFQYITCIFCIVLHTFVQFSGLSVYFIWKHSSSTLLNIFHLFELNSFLQNKLLGTFSMEIRAN